MIPIFCVAHESLHFELVNKVSFQKSSVFEEGTGVSSVVCFFSNILLHPVFAMIYGSIVDPLNHGASNLTLNILFLSTFSILHMRYIAPFSHNCKT